MEEEKEETGMDTTYVGIMVAVFLVLAALAVDIGYLYVSDEDLQTAAEKSAAAGAQAIKQRVLAQIKSDPARLPAVLQDLEQGTARSAAVETASGNHVATALVHVSSNGGNRLADGNDVTVGFWNMTGNTYTPGGAPVNAVQVRTRRTAEGEGVGLGSLGTILAKLSGVENFNYTPEAISALPPRATANFAVCADTSQTACRFPDVCSGERNLLPDGTSSPGGGGTYRYLYTTLQHQVTESFGVSDLICMDLPAQEVCGKQIVTARGEPDHRFLRDIESIMYNPNVDEGNKEADRNGNIEGWWVIAPVVDCGGAKDAGALERRKVSGYALMRLSRTCVEGSSGCRNSGTSFKAPAASCMGKEGLYFDRISFVGCGSRDLLRFPGLRPVHVK